MEREIMSHAYKEIGYCILLLMCAGVSLISLFKLFRPYFNNRVVCWFCQKQSSVPYGNRNCWDCLYCEQYNGFTKDGGYNKPIPSQHNEDLNYPINCTLKVSNFDQMHFASKLCERCTRNQTLKIKQLANFSPTNESRFDEEVEVYQSKLERAYKLCFQCQRQVSNELRRQNELLRPKLMKHMQRNKITSYQTAAREQVSRSLILQMASIGLKALALSFIILSLFIIVYPLPLVKLYMPSSLTTVHTVLKPYLLRIQLSGLVIQLVTILFNLLMERTRLRDFLHCVLWLLCYGHGVLNNHRLLPKSLASQLLPATFLLFILISTCLPKGKTSSKLSATRSPSSVDSKTWSSLVSNHSDSGVSDGYPNMNDVACEEYEAMDCAVADLSTLNLGEKPPQRNQNVYTRPWTPAPPYSRASGFNSSRSSYGGSVRSFHTAAPSMGRGYQPEPMLRSPSFSSVYSQPMNYPAVPSTIGFDAMSNHLSTPPSVSNYMSSRSSPDSPTSTIYSHMPVVPINQRVSPERTSLFTQIMLGISLGVNISIAAFILGRYSVNGDLLSFI